MAITRLVEKEWIFLASGSSGNASIVRWGQNCVLLDAGIGVRTLEKSLLGTGLQSSQIKAVVLSHTHSDHCNPWTILAFLEKGVPVFLEGTLIPALHKKLNGANLDFLIPLEPMGKKEILPGWILKTYPLPHGDMPNLGIVLELDQGPFDPGLRLGYLTDLGTWSIEIAQFAAGCDLLGLEFNHDVNMQKTSNRPSFLIQRNLGDGGHLSNEQAAACFNEILVQSVDRLPSYLVQLHLSSQCNTTLLAKAAAEVVLQRNLGQKISVKTCKPGACCLRIPWSGPRKRLAIEAPKKTTPLLPNNRGKISPKGAKLTNQLELPFTFFPKE